MENGERAEQLILRMHNLQDLLGHPGWQLLVELWREQEAHEDRLLHCEAVENVVNMARHQTTCRVLREVVALPETLLQELVRTVGEE